MNVEQLLKKIFPVSYGFADTVVNLVIGIVLYLIGGSLIGLVLGLLGKIPFVGIVFGIVGWAVGVYCFVGIVLLVLAFLKVLK